jgi:hypothetical protein
MEARLLPAAPRHAAVTQARPQEVTAGAVPLLQEETVVAAPLLREEATAEDHPRQALQALHTPRRQAVEAASPVAVQVRAVVEPAGHPFSFAA